MCVCVCVCVNEWMIFTYSLILLFYSVLSNLHFLTILM